MVRKEQLERINQRLEILFNTVKNIDMFFDLEEKNSLLSELNELACVMSNLQIKDPRIQEMIITCLLTRTFSDQ